MKKYPAIILSVFLVCYLPSVAAQLKVEIIPLHHRTADQIIPILSPLVSDGGAITGMNNQLIVKTTPANLEELKKVLASLDKPLHRLMITVRQDIDSTAARDRSSINGTYSTGDVTISNSSGRRGRTGAGINLTDENGNSIRLRNNSTHSALADSNDFHVQTVEGQPAWIQTGKSVPVANQTTYIRRDGVAVQDTVDYQDVTSGFYVIANLNGDNVTLSISPNLSRAHPHQGGEFEVQNIQTTVQGRLGEWISIGGIDQSGNHEDESFLSSTRRRNQETRTVLLKVDEIK